MTARCKAAGRPEKALAIGDALITDLKGAKMRVWTRLFIADGLHGEEIEPYTAQHLGEMFAGRQCRRQGGDASSEMVSVYYEDLEVGQSASMEKTVTERDVEMFGEATGDHQSGAFRRRLCRARPSSAAASPMACCPSASSRR